MAPARKPAALAALAAVALAPAAALRHLHRPPPGALACGGAIGDDQFAIDLPTGLYLDEADRVFEFMERLRKVLDDMGPYRIHASVFDARQGRWTVTMEEALPELSMKQALYRLTPEFSWLQCPDPDRGLACGEAIGDREFAVDVPEGVYLGGWAEDSFVERLVKVLGDMGAYQIEAADFDQQQGRWTVTMEKALPEFFMKQALYRLTSEFTWLQCPDPDGGR